MPTRRADSTPDLFGSQPIGSAPNATERPPVVQGKPKLEGPASGPRHLLPKDLAGALERLNDGEVDSLLAAVTAEARRRGRVAPTSHGREPTAADTSRLRRTAADVGAASLTTGKLNAVRAAFKAGVKPSAIARQFGISQADVKRGARRAKVGSLSSECRRGLAESHTPEAKWHVSEQSRPDTTGSQPNTKPS
jgi:hypothetical protein